MYRVSGAPGWTLLLVLGPACFAETSVYDDCQRTDCVGTSATEGTTSVATTTVAVDSTIGTEVSGDPSVDSSDAESSSPSTDATAETTIAESSSGDSEGGAARCGDGVIDSSEECEDLDDDDPFDGCHACAIVPELGWQYLDNYGDGDEVLALAPDGDHVLVAAIVDGGISSDDALWMRLDDGGSIDPASWFSLADLPDDNRVLDITAQDDTCIVGGFTDGAAGNSIARANTLTCATGQFASFLAFDESEQAGAEQMSAVVVQGDGRIVVGGRRMHGGALRGWIVTLDPSGQTTEATLWLDDPALFGESSEVRSLELAPGENVLVAGSWSDDAGPHGFVSTLAQVDTEVSPFGTGPSIATDVQPVATGVVAVGWTTSPMGDDDARVELIPSGGGATLVWELAEDGDDRIHAVTGTPSGIVVVGSTHAGRTDDDVLVVWLDDTLAEQHRAIWDGGANRSDGARDVVAHGGGVTLGGHIGTDADGQDLLVQHWEIP